MPRRQPVGTLMVLALATAAMLGAPPAGAAGLFDILAWKGLPAKAKTAMAPASPYLRALPVGQQHIMRRATPAAATVVRVAARVAQAGNMATPSARAAGPVMVVLDASGSMTEALGDRTKAEVMGEAARLLLDALDDGRTVGLTVFGAGGGCGSAEVVHPPSAGGLSRMRGTVERLLANPSGDTPLSAALETALRAAGKGPEITVLLLSDGGEGCGRDPVRTLHGLQQEGYRFRIHALTFERSYEPRVTMAAIAAIGRGRLLQFRPGDDVARRLRPVLDELGR